MVPVPVADKFAVVPLVRVAVKVKVSLFSLRLSCRSGTRTKTLVAPAENVAVVLVVHVVPPSVDI